MATILVVDDELGIRALLSEILSDEGHTIELAENATQARSVRERMRPEGIEPGDLDPKQFTEFVIAEVKRWTPVVKASGAKPE